MTDAANRESRVAGIDGAPNGWAVVVMGLGRPSIHKVTSLSTFVEASPDLEVVAIDVPIGLLDIYEGGRECDREARKILRKRGRSVFPTPVRDCLKALAAHGSLSEKHSFLAPCRVPQPSTQKA